MNFFKNKYKLSSILIIFIIFLVITFFYELSFYKIRDIYNTQTKDIILDSKKAFISDTINNLIYEINYDKNSYIDKYTQMIDEEYIKLNKNINLNTNDPTNYLINHFESYTDGAFLTVIICNLNTNEIIYSKSDLDLNNISNLLNSITNRLSYYHTLTYGDFKLLIGVSNNFIDNLTIKNIEAKIRAFNFNNNSYITVSKVSNFNGGDDYAKILINSKYPETEGTSLSTNILDIDGQTPYLTELDGINKYGELFYISSFNNLDNNLYEKITYSKLYSNFNWIISMHIYLNDIDTYITNINNKSSDIAFKTTLFVISLVIFVICICFLILYFIQKRYLNHSKALLENQMNTDELTSVLNRRGGILELKRAFNYYKKNNADIGIMMFDIDKFKTINDTLGHKVGDIVLKKISMAVSDSIRNSDVLIRWGGDEFIVIFYRLKRENAKFISDKIVSNIYNLCIPELNESITPSISVGFSYFKRDDNTYDDVLERADIALYKSKSKGRNQANIDL